MTIKCTSFCCFAPSQGEGKDEEGREEEVEGERRRLRERTISRVRALRALGLFKVMCPMPPGVRWARMDGGRAEEEEEEGEEEEEEEREETWPSRRRRRRWTGWRREGIMALYEGVGKGGGE